MLYVFLIFFLPVSKKGDSGCANSQNENSCVFYVIRLFFRLFYYYSMILVLLARCIVKVFILMI